MLRLRLAASPQASAQHDREKTVNVDVIFCGTPEFAVPTLNALVEGGFRVRLVVTQPDRPRGRGLEVTPSPVKRRADELALPVVQPEKIKSNLQFRAQLEAIAPRAIVVVGYGRMIPAWMIALPPLGNINLHASLLPKYRGAAPVQWAIARGESVTGVTTMRIDEGLDTGDILLQREEPIRPADTAVTLAPRLAAAGAALVVETLRSLDAGGITPRRQENSLATLAPVLRKDEGRMDFQRPARELHNRLRGFQPWPGAFTTFRGKNLNVWQAQPAEARMQLKPGELRVDGDRLVAGCGDESALELLEVQPEGKRRMPAHDFVNGYRLQPGERLG
ncbi:MAG TPA: methionyl-tRNA formyltransferase [Terriglobales bacterium]|nr:methionyl-tRNA formyltransferase [Terriglobales bacterium]